jgi:hypothetical protein
MTLNWQPLLIELLLSGFFAVACFKAREQSPDSLRVTPRSLFTLTDRLERLRRTRWQWCSMVLVLLAVRTQQATPMAAELTALAQFVVFLALPTSKPKRLAVRV